MTCSACVMCLCWGFSNFSLRESMLYDSDNLPLRTGHYFILKCRKYLNWICFCFYDRIISACRFRRAFNIDLSWVSLDKRRNCNGIARGFRAIGKLTWFRCGGWRQRRLTSDDNLNEKSINLLENPSWTLLQLNWPSLSIFMVLVSSAALAVLSMLDAEIFQRMQTRGWNCSVVPTRNVCSMKHLELQKGRLTYISNTHDTFTIHEDTRLSTLGSSPMLGLQKFDVSIKFYGNPRRLADLGCHLIWTLYMRFYTSLTFELWYSRLIICLSPRSGWKGSVPEL